MKEILEYTFLRQSLEQGDFVDRIGGRAKQAGFRRIPEPFALFRIPQVGVVMAGGRGIYPTQRLNRLKSVSRAVAAEFDDKIRRKPPQVVIGYVMKFRAQ